MPQEETMANARHATEQKALDADFRLAMRKLAAAITIITTRDGADYKGMTATAVASLSVDPPALVICINRSTMLHDCLTQSGRFCVNILAAPHEHLAGIFAGRLKGSARFQAGTWREDAAGERYLVGAAANLFCAIEHRHPYGTHSIFIGRVERILVEPDAVPLLYQDGAHGRFVAGRTAHLVEETWS